MKYLALIPARYASTRFPGKPLALLDGKPIIRRVYERVSRSFTHVYVATDDERIRDEVERFGGNVVMTRSDHQSGTDRCHEALEKVETATGQRFDIVVNVQGDEPFIAPAQLEAVRRCFDRPETQIATLVKPFPADTDLDTLRNPNSPKVVTDKAGHALYFSRSVVPFLRGVDEREWPRRHTYHKHIGLYAYRTDVLREITALPQSPLELCEKLEQLRWLEAGYRISVEETDIETIGIDTPDDLANAERFLRETR